MLHVKLTVYYTVSFTCNIYFLNSKYFIFNQFKSNKFSRFFCCWVYKKISLDDSTIAMKKIKTAFFCLFFFKKSSKINESEPGRVGGRGRLLLVRSHYIVEMYLPRGFLFVYKIVFVSSDVQH